ncbi:hypothetical protein PHYPSEUDO_012147 [Phytophthora pseudosyringae]|uniref:SET domain-containing protein n=1 Tax=Phytophthora pseudosyringae TaxID=221518 RepID=A0A8T1VC75_9STRA|nr:hypothetical protein PHYPSEUDO_012147 [Phytophthora pseudosyringae]
MREDELESRKRAHEAEDAEVSETEMEEQLCAQAAEALNHFIRSHNISASREVARNRLKNALYMIEQRRRREEVPVLADEISLEALHGLRVQTSELPGDPDRRVEHTVKLHLTNPSTTVYKRAVILPKVPSIPTATMWTALSKNYEVEDEPTLKYLPYFGDDDEEDVVSEFYQIKQQRTSTCEVEFTKEMCEGVLKTLQSTWDLTPSDLKRVGSVINVEEEVLVEVHKKLRISQRAAKKKRRTEAANARINLATTNGENASMEDPAEQTNISMKEYFELYKQSADSYRSLFCRRCCVYDCDYHGCLEQSKLSISEQNAVALNLQEKDTMINTGRNCGNSCFLGQMSLSSPNGFSKDRAISASFGWSAQTRILCARVYFLCSGNFCEMAKILGNKTCAEVAEMCAYYDFNDRSLPKEVCCADEIATREMGEAYDSKSDKTSKDEKQQTSCQNRSIALSKQKHVRMGRSKLSAAGWGLFVEDYVAKDEFIIEYIGEMVSQEEADRRGSVYDKVDRSYLFNLDTKTVIDSTRKGNKTRFINHSSRSPNCACKIMNVSSDFRIGLYAMHDIQPHTELFFDYGYDKELYHAELLKQPTVTEWMKK